MCIHLQSQKLTFTWNDMFARYFACAYRPGEVCAYRPGEVCAYRPGAYVCPNYCCTFTTLSPCPTIISSTGPVGWFCIALTVAPSSADVVSKIRTKYTHPPPNTPEYPVNPWVALTLSNCLHSYGWSGVGWRGWGGWGLGGELAAEKRFWIPALGFSPLYTCSNDSCYPGLKNFFTSERFLLL